MPDVSPKASVGATAASETIIEKVVGGDGPGSSWFESHFRFVGAFFAHHTNNQAFRDLFEHIHVDTCFNDLFVCARTCQEITLKHMPTHTTLFKT